MCVLISWAFINSFLCLQPLSKSLALDKLPKVSDNLQVATRAQGSCGWSAPIAVLLSTAWMDWRHPSGVRTVAPFRLRPRPGQLFARRAVFSELQFRSDKCSSDVVNDVQIRSLWDSLLDFHSFGIFVMKAPIYSGAQSFLPFFPVVPGQDIRDGMIKLKWTDFWNNFSF